MTADNQTASLYDLFETSSEAEVAGTWVPVGPARFLLARMGGANDKFMTTASKRTKPFQGHLESLPKKTSDDLAIGIFVDTVLLNWENVVDRNKQELPFSKENAKTLLQDLPNLLAVLHSEAMKISNFTQAALDAAAKN